jgi:hypothetical protein
MTAHIEYFEHIFFPKIWVGIAFTEKSYLKECKRLNIAKPPSYIEKAAAITPFVKDDGYLTLIICFDPLRDKLHKNQIAALLAHEAVHASDYIFENIDEDKPGMEIRAYLVQYIVQQSLYAMDKFLKRKKK